MIPHVSPITSLQTLETLLAFRISIRELLAPLTFDAAMEWNGFSSVTVTATPTISNRIPMKIIAIRTINATTVVDFLSSKSEKVLIKIDNKNAKIVIKTTILTQSLQQKQLKQQPRRSLLIWI